MTHLSNTLKMNRITYRSLVEHLFATRSNVVSDAIRELQQKRCAKEYKRLKHKKTPETDSDEEIVLKPTESEEIVLKPTESEEIVLKSRSKP
jgi:Arc/MetJ-type ribon-helix-helix transcriptional regulator